MNETGQAVLWAINGFTEESVKQHLPAGHQILRSFSTEWKTAYVIEGPDLVASDTPLCVDILFVEDYSNRRRKVCWAHKPGKTWVATLGEWADARSA